MKYIDLITKEKRWHRTIKPFLSTWIGKKWSLLGLRSSILNNKKVNTQIWHITNRGSWYHIIWNDKHKNHILPTSGILVREKHLHLYFKICVAEISVKSIWNLTSLCKFKNTPLKRFSICRGFISIQTKEVATNVSIWCNLDFGRTPGKRQEFWILKYFTNYHVLYLFKPFLFQFYPKCTKIYIGSRKLNYFFMKRERSYNFLWQKSINSQNQYTICHNTMEQNAYHWYM